MSHMKQVPQPKTYGPLGNLPLLDSAAPVQSLVKVASELGPIFQFQYPGGRRELYVSGHEYVKDACDEKRFDKRIWAPLQNVRPFAGDGLFTSATHEPNWKKAHNILLSSFSQRAMQGYHTKMVDIAMQLIQKWARLNPDESVDVPADMTRLTLDTLKLPLLFNHKHVLYAQTVLGVLPINPVALVQRVLRRFKLDAGAHLILSAEGRSGAHLPSGIPVRLDDLLFRSVELQEPATRAQIREMAACMVCPPHAKELQELLVEATYQAEVRAKRITMLDLLERYEACELPFERFLELLPPLKPRYYSISSSPKVSPNKASITVSVVRERAWSGQGEYRGVASNYLEQLETCAEVLMFIRSPESGFALQEDPATPIIMIGPGTGVAPFRGFIQARQALREAGQELGAAHLYFGCRNPEQDYLYREEFEQAEREGLVTLHTAFSRIDGADKCYVQHLMRRDGALLLSLLEEGARMYICGDGSRMAPEVEQTLMLSYREKHGVSAEEAAAWLSRLEASGQYVKDVWAG